MKILILQLARLGDIYMSWPAMRALRRKFPEAEIHCLVRPGFAEAMEGLTAVHQIHLLPTDKIITPLIQENMDVQASFDSLSLFLDQLNEIVFDRIYNFSFSPASSYITHFLSRPQTGVVGYTRFQDGYLSIPDDMSAYFYAQIGTGRPNRFHLIDIFASLVGSDLTSEDYRLPHPLPVFPHPLPSEYIVFHVGASESQKNLSIRKWAEVLKLTIENTDLSVILIGSEKEVSMGRAILDELSHLTPTEDKKNRIINIIGCTRIKELFPILKGSQMLVGCDSAPMHIATFTGTPCVNISLASVNFWETGPRSLESVVVRGATEMDLPAEKIFQVMDRLMHEEKQDLSVIHTTGGIPSYWALTSKVADFDWLFLRALYMGEDFPSNDDPHFIKAFSQLSEMNQIMIQQMERVERTGDVSPATPFIESGEEVIETIGKLVSSTQVLIRWYQTEKIRIPPGDMMSILKKTLNIHQLLQKVLDLYSSSIHEANTELR